MRAGVNVCLGTDSLASVYQRRKQSAELSMFEEMRALAERESALSPRTLLRLATTCGAQALGLRGKTGEIISGAYADLIALPSTAKISRVYDTVLEHRGNVSANMIGGRWAMPPDSESIRMIKR